MKTANAAVIALLNARPPAYFSADLYTIVSPNGPTLRLTPADFDAIDLSGNIYSSGGLNSGYPKIDLKDSKVQGHAKRGLDSDTWTIGLAPTTQDPFTGVFTYPDVVGGTPWQTACRIGMFDGATVLVQRSFFPAPPTPPYSVATRTCVGAVSVFQGIIGTVDCSQTQCFFTLNDWKYLLGQNMPRNLIQASCRHLLFDARCTLNASSYAKAAVALAGSSRASLLATPAAPSGSGTYTLGRMVGTSGANSGFQRTIMTWDGVEAFVPQVPWPFAPAAGDGFTFYPGCDKTTATCTAFGNLVNFGGMPRVPMPEIQMG